MTTDLINLDEEIRNVIPGVARFDGNTVTFGTYAAGGDVNLLLADENGARNVVVTGGSGTGKTALLHSLLAGANAHLEARRVDPYQSDVQSVVERYRSLVAEGRSDHQVRILLVDDLTGFDDETLTALEHVARFGRTANVALVVASQDVRMGGRGGRVLQHLADAPLIHFNGPLPGVGEVNGDVFRAWWTS